MELMEIITSSVSLFMAISFILIVLSYIIFKIKDYSRIKAHARVNIRNSTVLSHDLTSIQRPEYLSTRNSQNHQQITGREITFQNTNRSPCRDKQIKRDFSKFKVLNETSTARSGAAMNLKMRTDNIFELYSQNEQERMHKLKLAVSYK